MATGTRADAARKEKDQSGAGEFVPRQQALWWICLGSGILSISLTIGMATGPIAWLLGLILPIVILLAYAYFGLQRDTIGGGRGQFADTVYYLGFLFTLITLVAALIELGLAGDSAGGMRTQLVSRFGLALTTTILGLAIRVWVVNLSRTSDGLEEEAEELLTDKVDDFRVALTTSIENLNTLTTTHHEALGAALEDSRKKFDEQADAAVESMSKVTALVEEGVIAYMAKMEEKTEQMQLPLEVLNNSLREPFKSLREEIEAATVEAKGITTAKTKLSSSLARLIKRFETSEEGLDAFDAVIKRLDNTSGEFGRLAGQVDGWNKAISSGAENISSAGTSVIRVSESMVSGFAGLEKVLNDTESLKTALESRVAAIETFNTANDESLNRTKELYQRLLKDVSDASTTLSKSVARG